MAYNTKFVEGTTIEVLLSCFISLVLKIVTFFNNYPCECTNNTLHFVQKLHTIKSVSSIPLSFCSREIN